MDISSPSSDPYQSGWIDLTGTSTLPNSRPYQASSHSDEDIILASSKPKKRAGRTKFKETRHPVYRGIRRRNKNRWVCEVREPKKKTRIWLGTYPTAEMAARAHDVAALALRGTAQSAACLNFADSVWRLPVPPSMEAQDIRKTANEAAKMFRPRDDEDQEVSRNVTTFDRDSSSEGAMAEFVCNYNDEEEMLNMPRLILDMAEGMMLSPPRYTDGDLSWQYEESTDAELSLWSYSF